MFNFDLQKHKPRLYLNWYKPGLISPHHSYFRSVNLLKVKYKNLIELNSCIHDLLSFMAFDYSLDPFEGLIEEIFRFFEGKYLFLTIDQHRKFFKIIQYYIIMTNSW